MNKFQGFKLEFIYVDIPGIAGKKLLAQESVDFGVDNCESLQELKECYGDKVAISGNVPPVDVLKNGHLKKLTKAIKKCIIELETIRGDIISALDVPLR